MIACSAFICSPTPPRPSQVDFFSQLKPHAVPDSPLNRSVPAPEHCCAAAVVLIAGFIIMDQQGLIVLPGMGALYDVSGVEDPNTDRALERTENKLAAEDLDPKKRAQLESLRRKLLDKTNSEASDKGGKKSAGGGGTQKQPDAGAKEGVPNEPATGTEQHDIAQQLFNDAQKQNVDVKLASPEAIQTPNLPEGLTQEAIYKVVHDNNTSMKLCYAEAVTVVPSGRLFLVINVAIPD